MLSVHILCVGKLKERFYLDAAQEYIKRLSPYCRLTVQELSEQRLPPSPSQAQIDAALAQEGRAIASHIPVGAFVVALCVEGVLYSSPRLAELVRQRQQDGEHKHLVFLIGGSFGLDEALKTRADARLSMSPMTFPHHLARVMLLEQLYRAFKINEGSAYHK